MKLIKPKKLNVGDTIATVSLSWGGAGDSDFLWRYKVGKERLEQVYGLRVIEMEHTLSGSDYIYNHPEKRAENLMNAFKNPEIKAIFSCIGGDDSIRMLPYIDFDVIKANPKIFLGYSDSTITHLICYKAGLSSFYGPSILAEFAENVEIFDYTDEYVRKVLFESKPIGNILPADEWTGERIEWLEENSNIRKKMEKNLGYEFIQGKGIVQGRLFGGCVGVLEMTKGTELWPDIPEDTILFFETSEEMHDPINLKYWLRNYGASGILQNAKAILFGKPYQGKYYEEYKEVIKQILEEFNINNTPVVLNMTFGHNEPMCILPYGALAEVNCESRNFTILESGVID